MRPSPHPSALRGGAAPWLPLAASCGLLMNLMSRWQLLLFSLSYSVSDLFSSFLEATTNNGSFQYYALVLYISLHFFTSAKLKYRIFCCEPFCEYCSFIGYGALSRLSFPFFLFSLCVKSFNVFDWKAWEIYERPAGRRRTHRPAVSGGVGGALVMKNKVVECFEMFIQTSRRETGRGNQGSKNKGDFF